ncbi:MAG TPA: LysM domain-containing protein [Actinomycetota bacterium]|nr:LysM domain-containing protein [Actinomycetota bacterium]
MDLLQQLLAAGAVTQQAFGPESRYVGLPIRTLAAPDGTPVSYVSRRFIAAPGAFAVLQRYRVREGDRVDVVAATLVGNPLSYWQLCDANLALEPSDLTGVPGAFIVVTLPAGVPGAPAGG